MIAKINVQNPKKSMPRKLPENISKKNPANKAELIGPGENEHIFSRKI